MLWLQPQHADVPTIELMKETFTDAELTSSLMDANRTEPALRFLYREHFSLLSHYIQTNNGSQQDAEDIFQDVMLAFVNLVRAGRFRGESSVRTFLFSLNKNMWLNELKRRGRAAVREEKYERLQVRSEAGADVALEAQQTKARLLQVVGELGENCRKILLLFYFENRSMKEILTALPYENEQVVRNKKSKCLKKLETLVTADSVLYQQLKTYIHG